ncbi:MAG: hypothetical protein IJ728_03160 [Selenomonadaceae bacterium]|nr:hypothetical protein [Selenomonadaceae bacterium]
MQTVIYIGPNVKGTILRQFTAFIDGIPKEYQTHKIYKNLFVPVENLESALIQLNQKGTKINTFYKQARGDK